MLIWARQRNHVLPVLVGSIGVAVSMTTIATLGWHLGIIAGLLTLFLLYLEIVTSGRSALHQNENLRSLMKRGSA